MEGKTLSHTESSRPGADASSHQLGSLRLQRPFGLALLLPCWLAMAWLVSEAKWFWNNRPDLQFGWIVLILCCYLIWEAWETRPVFRVHWDWPAVSIGFVGFASLSAFQVYRMAFGTTPAALFCLAFGVMMVAGSNLSYVFGTAGIRHFGFAFGFLLVSLPLPGILYVAVVTGLQSFVASLSVDMLNLVGVPARRSGSVIHLAQCIVGVDEACSGIRSLQSTVMATLFIGYLTLKRAGLRVLLFGIGVLLAIVGNLMRSFYLSYAANARGLQGMESVHDTAGWSILLFTAVGVGLSAWLLSNLEKTVQRENKDRELTRSTS